MTEGDFIMKLKYTYKVHYTIGRLENTLNILASSKAKAISLTLEYIRIKYASKDVDAITVEMEE